MRKHQTEILVIGGGATGTGILRDLAMRGFHATLVERRDLTDGTTGRFHGLLHSGARYVVKDPEAARECIDENRILRRIMPHCIEDTGGFFVLTPTDDPTYIPRFLEGCHKADIPAEEVPIRQMLAREPRLNPEISHCLRVPDAAVDGFAAARANAAAAREYGAHTLTYHEVTELLTNRQSAITGVICRDLLHDELVQINTDLIINAAGAWAGKIGALAGLEITIRPGKGTLIALAHRVVHTVINRLKMPGDGDILVPAHTVAVMGTTDIQVPDPDQFGINPQEVKLLLNEGEKIIPGFSQLRVLRAWAGVRPLYQETRAEHSRDITRSFVLLDHEARDGVPGMLTITGGKWTTYRKMAEITVDKACQKLGTTRECRTHLEMLPESSVWVTGRQSLPSLPDSHHSALGHRLARIEREQAQGDLICECELVTRNEIVAAIQSGTSHNLGDLRRGLRLGMGPCQGGFCTLRAAGIWEQITTENALESHSDDQKTDHNTSQHLRAFLQERWKGLLPILWGDQLRQERLNELIYTNVLGVRGEGHEEQDTGYSVQGTAYDLRGAKYDVPGAGYDVQGTNIIIGGGLAGLTAAWHLASRGEQVKLLAKGWGATHWSSGCVDVLGYAPIGAPAPVESPRAALEDLIRKQPEHPYARVGIARLEIALQAFQALCAEAGYPLHGSLERNWMLPTAVGAPRPTCLAPETFTAGDLRVPSPMLLVGIVGYHDFSPHLAASNLRGQDIPVEAVNVDLPGLAAHQRRDAMTLARFFDKVENIKALAAAIRPHLGGAERVGMPAVLGLDDPLWAVRELEARLGRRVFEIPGLPPSVPGLRLHRILLDSTRAAGGRVFTGMEVIGAEIEENRATGVWVKSAARPSFHAAGRFILATGGFLGSGFQTDHTGYAQEIVFNLPLDAPPNREDWFHPKFLHPQGHPIFRAGVRVDTDFRTALENVYAAGGALPGDFIREYSLEGTALASGFWAGERAK